MFKLLNPNELLRQLQKDNVSLGTQMWLLTLLFFCQCLFSRPGIVNSFAYWRMFSWALLNIVIGLTCLWGSYFCNGGPNGINFFSRFITLSAVLYLWIYLGGALIYAGIYWIARYNDLTAIVNLYNNYGIPQLIFAVVTSSLFLLTLMHYMYRAAHDQAA